MVIFYIFGVYIIYCMQKINECSNCLVSGKWVFMLFCFKSDVYGRVLEMVVVEIVQCGVVQFFEYFCDYWGMQ